MQPFADYLNDFFKGKSLYSPIVRALGVLLSASIASAMFKRRYFDYTLLDITDYKGIYRFFISGDFAVPLILFVVVHYGIGFLSQCLFYGLSYVLRHRWMKMLGELGVGEHRPFFVRCIAWLREVMSEKERQRIRRLVNEARKILTLNFKLTTKAMIALSIFLAIVPYFGWRLYMFAMLCCAVGLGFFICSYTVLDIVPEVVKKLEQPVPFWAAPARPASDDAKPTDAI